ncbi:MAG: GWxTD domain-containing protein [Bacteroidia bacterium]|nr:GWxTD domain-containing protein [Bacteroidia bacterium]
MKKVALFIILLGGLVFGQNPNGGPGLFLDVCRFNFPFIEAGSNSGNDNTLSGSPFVEIQIAVAGNSLSFIEEAPNSYQAKVHIDLRLFKLENGDTIQVDRDRYNLQLPPERKIQDTTLNSRQKANLLNVHTLRVEAGKYLINATAVDSFSLSLIKSQAIREFNVEALVSEKLAFSDVKWSAGEIQPNSTKKRVATARRANIIPMVTNQTFINEKALSFYMEIYNANQVFGEKANITMRSVIYQGDNRLFNYQSKDKPSVAGIINVFKEEIPIENLPSNIYYLQIEVFAQGRPMKTFRQKFYVYNSSIASTYDRNTIASNSDVDVFNSYTEEELEYYLQTLRYQATIDERNFIKVLENYQQKKNFIFSYFERRKSSDKTVRALWNGHLMALKYVNQEFKSALKEGWQTDRGRVLLTHGIPNHVDRHPSQSGMIPYEIWRYNKLGPQNSVLFVFYDPDLATNEYQLLHSNKYGEINNPRWRTLLDSRNKGQTSDLLDYESDRTIYNPKLDLDDN